MSHKIKEATAFDKDDNNNDNSDDDNDSNDMGEKSPYTFPSLLLHVLICLFTLAVLVISVLVQCLAHLDFDISVFIIDNNNTMFENV